MKCSLGISNFLEEISTLPFYYLPLFLCIAVCIAALLGDRRTQGEGAETLQETEPDLPVSVWESPVEVRADSGPPRG